VEETPTAQAVPFTASGGSGDGDGGNGAARSFSAIEGSAGTSGGGGGGGYGHIVVFSQNAAIDPLAQITPDLVR
jgi:hypothetical protein